MMKKLENFIRSNLINCNYFFLFSLKISYDKRKGSYYEYNIIL